MKVSGTVQNSNSLFYALLFHGSRPKNSIKTEGIVSSYIYINAFGLLSFLEFQIFFGSKNEVGGLEEESYGGL